MNEAIQFPRLIAELNAAGVFQEDSVMECLETSMDCTKQEILDIVERAEAKFDKDKKNIRT
jgi:hypothetical protein